MMGDPLEDYFGKLVMIKAREGRDGHPIYVGRVSNYDSDFITLSPYLYLLESSSQKVELERLSESEAGATKSRKTLGRKSIDSIEEFDLKNYRR